MPYPVSFGKPCWEKDQADKCTNIVAQVSQEKSGLFLATHSPIKNIRDVRANSSVTEEVAFNRIFERKGELRAVVRGGPGTGKSHLIRWICLRVEWASNSGELDLDKFKIVMVQRETGSLRAALNQIVNQLGGEFSQYVEDIKNSVSRFSDKTARAQLISDLALEISQKWEERGLPPLKADLSDLGDVLHSPGFREWLARDGGVIAKKIERLTEASTHEERNISIEFSPEELLPEPGYLDFTKDAQQVHEFVDLIRYDSDTQDSAIRVLNEALINALREFTGIRGAKLIEIFSSIRKKLFEQGRQLAVFIEDVTAASGGLDVDLYQAFEPKEIDGHCRMVALLGMTNDGWKLVPDNERQRVNFEFDIGEGAHKWAENQIRVSNFAARYLNAIRCSDQEISQLAKNRFDTDVPWSKCDECPHKENCHNTFGYSELSSRTRIGLFPFTKSAISKLLRALNDEGQRHSPRGLLDLVLDKTLVQSYFNLEQTSFPDSRNYGVHRPTLTYWTDFQNRYLGGSPWALGQNRDRAYFLAQFWVDSSSANEIGRRLENLRGAFSLPQFSEGVSEGEPVPPEAPPIEPEEPNSELKNKELEALLLRLEEWKRGKPLNSDAKFREMLLGLLTKAIGWSDQRKIPIKVVSSLLRGTKPLRIKGQVSRPGGQLYFLDFERNEETYNLLEALTRFEKQGNKSWQFNNAELHRRRVSSWIRRHQSEVIESMCPYPLSLKDEAIVAASQTLAIAAVLKSRSRFKKTKPESRLESLFGTVWDKSSAPKSLSGQFSQYVASLEIFASPLKELLINEIGVGQGNRAPKTYINPLPILKATRNFHVNVGVEVPSQQITERFWKTRFEAVSRLQAFVNFRQVLQTEKAEILIKLNEINRFLTARGYTIQNQESVKQFLEDLVSFTTVQRKNMPYPSQDFDFLWRSNRLIEEKTPLAKGISSAQKLTESSKDIDVLCFDPTYFEEAWKNLTMVISIHLDRVETELMFQEKAGGKYSGGTKEDFLDKLSDLIATGTEFK